MNDYYRTTVNPHHDICNNGIIRAELQQQLQAYMTEGFTFHMGYDIEGEGFKAEAEYLYADASCYVVESDCRQSMLAAMEQLLKAMADRDASTEVAQMAAAKTIAQSGVDFYL